VEEKVLLIQLVFQVVLAVVVLQAEVAVVQLLEVVQPIKVMVEE
jgi:hypothetical protein